jgi:hypothetical protein
LSTKPSTFHYFPIYHQHNHFELGYRFGFEAETALHISLFFFRGHFDPIVHLHHSNKGLFVLQPSPAKNSSTSSSSAQRQARRKPHNPRRSRVCMTKKISLMISFFLLLCLFLFQILSSAHTPSSMLTLSNAAFFASLRSSTFSAFSRTACHKQKWLEDGGSAHWSITINHVRNVTPLCHISETGYKARMQETILSLNC